MCFRDLTLVQSALEQTQIVMQTCAQLILFYETWRLLSHTSMLRKFYSETVKLVS